MQLFRACDWKACFTKTIGILHDDTNVGNNYNTRHLDSFGACEMHTQLGVFFFSVISSKKLPSHFCLTIFSFLQIDIIHTESCVFLDKLEK